MASIIHPNGKQEPLNPPKLSLAELQKAVGGYIEMVKAVDGTVMYCNEDGIALRLELNPAASMLANQQILGRVVKLTAEETAREFDAE